jgi:hypothetical protein
MSKCAGEYDWYYSKLPKAAHFLRYLSVTEWAVEKYRDMKEQGVTSIPTVDSLMVYRSQGEGWSVEGIDFFNKMVNDLLQLRKTSSSKLLEKTYMENLNKEKQAKKARKGMAEPATQAVDGLQEYLKILFPNGNAGQESSQTKRPRISIGSENSDGFNNEQEGGYGGTSSDEEDDDVDGGGNGQYPQFDEENVGQRRGV